jgi:hypothetical protein
MGLLDKIRGRKQAEEDPFAAGDNPFSSTPTTPSMTPDPFAPPNTAGPGGFQQGNNGYPGNFNAMAQNPDLNAALGIPKPRDRAEDFASQTSAGYPQSPQSNTSSSSGIEKDLQLIIAKIDTLKAELDSINQRIQHVERIADAAERQNAPQQPRPAAPQYPRW